MAQVFTTSDAPWYWILFAYRNSDINMVKRATLQFFGISLVKVTRFSGVRLSEDKQRLEWIENVKKAVV